MDVIATGLCTAFGTGQAAIDAALAKEKEAMVLRPDFIGSDYRPQLCLFAPDAPLDGVAPRVTALVAEALADLAAQLAAGQIAWQPETALVLLTPGPDTGLTTETAQGLSDQTLAGLRNAGWVAPAAVAVALQGGAGSTVRALAAVAEFCAAGRPVLLIVADSHACRTRLEALLGARTLFSKENPWGFVPAEAASATLFLPALSAPPSQVRLRFTAIAEGLEPVPAHMNADSSYNGLSDAAIAALDQHARTGLGAPADVLTDWNNSRYRAAEFSYAVVRMTGQLDAGFAEADHPCQRFGQCGAGWLTAVLASPPPQGDGARLVLCGNEGDGTRGAFVLYRPSAAAA
jgi:hypothetical protein